MNASPHPIELHNWDEPSIPRNTWRQRLAIFTPSTEPSSQYISHLYRPLQVLVTIPAVTYVTIQYSSTLVWFAVVATTQSQYFSLPPYNFGTIGIGLLNLSPFIGSVFGCAWGGPLSDWSIQVMARRNENIYEPEMRLYISIVPGIVGPAGLFLYGYTIAEVSPPPQIQSKTEVRLNPILTKPFQGLPWILPCLGSGLYGFSMAALIPIVLVYLSDSYHKVSATNQCRLSA
jgi:MFS family permease